MVLIVLPSLAIAQKKYKSNPFFQNRFVRYVFLLPLLYLSLKEQELFNEIIHLPSKENIRSWLLQILFSLMLVLALDGLSLISLLRNKLFLLRMHTAPEIRYSQGIASIPGRNKIAVIIISVCAGVWEEILFRGLLFYYLEKAGFPMIIIFLISSLLFAINHYSAGRAQMIYSFFFGLIYCLIYFLTGNIIAAILSHIAGNLFVFLVSIPMLRKKAAEFVFF